MHKAKANQHNNPVKRCRTYSKDRWKVVPRKRTPRFNLKDIKSDANEMNFLHADVDRKLTHIPNATS